MIAIYARQSVDKGEQSLSIAGQIEECKKRFSGSANFEVYQDRGFTGANTNRPEFQRMMTNIKSGRIEKVIIWKLDRISRSLLDFAKIIEVFNTYHVSFDSVVDNFDTSTPMGRAMLSIVMVFAQLERETIQLRIIANYQQRAEKGFFLGGPAIFGLEKIPITIGGYRTSTYKLHAVHGETLLQLFGAYADSDISLRKLAYVLNEKGAFPDTGLKWTPQKISRILRSPTYVQSDADIYEYYKGKGVNMLSAAEDFNGNGLYLYGKRNPGKAKYTNVAGHNLAVALHEGVVDSRTWLRVQYRLEENISFGANHNGKTTWLSGLAKCAHCGYAMSGNRVHGKVYLRCSHKLNTGGCKESSTVHAEWVESQVWNQILEKVDELRNASINQKSNADVRINQLRLQLIQIEESIDNLVSAIAGGNTASVKAFSERIESLDAERTAINEQLQKITVESTTINSDTILKLMDGELGLEEKHGIAKALMKKVFIAGNHQPIDVDWLF